MDAHKIYTLDGGDLEYLADVLAKVAKRGGKVRFTIDGGLKFKVDEDMWTPPYGYRRDFGYCCNQGTCDHA